MMAQKDRDISASLIVDRSMTQLEIASFFVIVLVLSSAAVSLRGFPEPGVGQSAGMAWFQGAAFLIAFIPMLGAIACAALFRGRRGLNLLWLRTKKLRINYNLYVFSFFSVVFVNIIHGVIISLWMGTPFLHGSPGELLAGFSISFAILLVLVIGEELGWRGYAQPGLQAYVTPFTTSLIIGVIWGVWHYLVFWGYYVAITGNEIYGWIGVSEMTILPILFSFVFTWMFNKCHGAMITALILHAANNAATGVFVNHQILEDARGLDFFVVSHGSALPFLIIVVFLIARDREMFFRRVGDDADC